MRCYVKYQNSFGCSVAFRRHCGPRKVIYYVLLGRAHGTRSERACNIGRRCQLLHAKIAIDRIKICYIIVDPLNGSAIESVYRPAFFYYKTSAKNRHEPSKQTLSYVNTAVRGVDGNAYPLQHKLYNSKTKYTKIVTCSNN